MPATGSQQIGDDLLSSRLIDTVCRRLREGKRVRRTLPDHGRIHIDRQLPFLCIHRRKPTDHTGELARLTTSEASYLIGSARRRQHDGLALLLRGVSSVLVEQFGACLLLELRELPVITTDEPVATEGLIPRFRVLPTPGASHPDVTEELETALRHVKLGRRKAQVSTANTRKRRRGTLPPLLDAADAAAQGCMLYTLEVEPVYRDARTGEVFPHVLRRLRRDLSIALKRVFFAFARRHTTHRPAHYHELGRRAVVKAVWDVDRVLAEASEPFDFLLQVTPVNATSAWSEFERTKYERRPTFHYRPLPADPVDLKRNLYKAPVARVEDPALALIFRQKIDELDRQITMLADRNTSRFLHGSIQLFGGVEDELYDQAIGILEHVPPRSRDRSPKGHLNAQQFAEQARHEIAYLRQQDPALRATVSIRDDVAGLIVSRGNLFIGDRLRVPESRAPALLQHEVGTHIVTYHNGRSQPFRQLYTGLAGCDALQEGLAVLSEHLVGGLSRPRLRLLAARVVAVRSLVDGATFIDTYRALKRTHGFARRDAFMVTMRVYRGGGFTKDAVYLRGLRQVLEHFRKGGDLGPLLVGKIGIEHIPIINELLWRGVLKTPPLRPRYAQHSDAGKKLERLRHGVSVMELTKGR